MDLTGHTKMPMLKVIRVKCLDCASGQPGQVRNCAITACPLWPYRMGKNPFAVGRPLDSETAKNLHAKRVEKEREKA
jgi:hypothetical protein